MLISAVVTHHLGAAVAMIAASTTVLFSVVEAASTETVGIGTVVALLVTIVGMVFRTQQQQIRSQRNDMDHMANRIMHLEAELDHRRRGDY